MRNGYKSQHGTWLLVLVSSRLLLPERGLLQEWLEELQALLAPPTLLSRLHFSPDCVCLTAAFRCCAHPSTTKPTEIQTFPGGLERVSPLFDTTRAGAVARRPACVCCSSAEPHSRPNTPTWGGKIFISSLHFFLWRAVVRFHSTTLFSCSIPPRIVKSEPTNHRLAPTPT